MSDSRAFDPYSATIVRIAEGAAEGGELADGEATRSAPGERP